ncbi:MAG: rod-binding protein [Bacteriovoracaceae bacterium]|nr:rod-binding protein [Bacteriovoracaceae bacterium]
MPEVGKVNSNFPASQIAKKTQVKERDTTEEKIESLANQMESNFTDLMVKEMRKTIPREEVSGAQSFYEGLMDREYADKLAAQIDLGILDQLKTKMGLTNKNDNRPKPTE